MSFRSQLPPGSPRWAARLAHWHVLGLEPDALDKPKIAVVNSSSELAICYSHLDQVAQRVKAAIRAAGGVPFEIRTVAPSDFITSVGAAGGYILSARDLIAFDTEAMVEGAMLDGMVCLSSCDKTLPGHLIAAARLDIPTVILPCGYQPSGCCQGEPVDLEEVFIRATQYIFGYRGMPVAEVWWCSTLWARCAHISSRTRPPQPFRNTALALWAHIRWGARHPTGIVSPFRIMRGRVCVRKRVCVCLLCYAGRVFVRTRGKA